MREESDCDTCCGGAQACFALQLKGYVRTILPLLIGQCDEVFDRSSFAQSPSEVPKIQVRALETKLRERLDNHCLGSVRAP